MVDEPGDTVTVATVGADDATVADAVALLPLIVAVIVAVPAATPVTIPDVETVATPVFELVHVVAYPVSTLPLASFAVAVRPVLWPAVSDTVVGEIVTDATAALATVTLVVADTPPMVTVMVADPEAAAVTRPFDDTVATLVFELLHDAT